MLVLVEAQAAQALVVRSYYYFFYLYANVPWHSYRRRLLLHNDRVSLRETWLWPLAFEGVMLQRFEFTKVCMGKNVNLNFSQNFDIFAIKMTYLNALLSFLLSSCFSARSVAIWASYRFSCDNSERSHKDKKNNNSSQRELGPPVVEAWKKISYVEFRPNSPVSNSPWPLNKSTDNAFVQG